MKQGLIIDENGDKEWFLNGQRHREDGPAVELSNGTKLWYLNGQRHRVDGPAVELPYGYKYWNGTKYWYLNDQLVYSRDVNNLHKYPNLSESFKNSIIKYRLTL
jgi:hypothetical protein